MTGADAVRRLIIMSGAALVVGCGSDFPTTPAVMQGTAVTDAGLTMTVTNTSQPQTIGSLFPWGDWVVVKLHVSNVSDKQALFDPMFQQLFIDGHEFEPNPLAAEAVDDNTSSAASLDPGSEADVVLAFDVYIGVPYAKKAVQLVVRADLNSPGAVVNLTVR
jgi:hypothetical protein